MEEERFLECMVQANSRDYSKTFSMQATTCGCLLVKDNLNYITRLQWISPGCPHEQKLRDGHEIATVHAEMNAITDCAKRGVSSLGSTAYITHYPCKDCMKALVHQV